MVIMHLSVLKEKGSVREYLDLEDLDNSYMLMKKKKKKNLIKIKSEDELGFIAIKEDDLDKEIREESVLISQFEKKDWIIDSGCSHHKTSDMNKYVKFKNHDGGIVRVGNNVACHIT